MPRLIPQKERLTKDVRYQEFNEVTPDVMENRTSGVASFLASLGAAIPQPGGQFAAVANCGFLPADFGACASVLDEMEILVQENGKFLTELPKLGILYLRWRVRWTAKSVCSLFVFEEARGSL